MLLFFYKDKNPVRLMVINKNTDIDKCIKIALTQYFENETLQVLYDNLQIKSSIIDIKKHRFLIMLILLKKLISVLVIDGIFYIIC